MINSRYYQENLWQKNFLGKRILSFLFHFWNENDCKSALISDEYKDN